MHVNTTRSKLVNNDDNSCEWPITNKKNITKTKNGKAPGTDGLPIEFYNKN